jgi:hypothetical protein
MPPKELRKITQETFDEAVRENIETFDMSPEEALESTIEEFKLQVGPLPHPSPLPLTSPLTSLQPILPQTVTLASLGWSGPQHPKGS